MRDRRHSTPEIERLADGLEAMVERFCGEPELYWDRPAINPGIALLVLSKFWRIKLTDTPRGSAFRFTARSMSYRGKMAGRCLLSVTRDFCSRENQLISPNWIYLKPDNFTEISQEVLLNAIEELAILFLFEENHLILNHNFDSTPQDCLDTLQRYGRVQRRRSGSGFFFTSKSRYWRLTRAT